MERSDAELPDLGQDGVDGGQHVLAADALLERHLDLAAARRLGVGVALRPAHQVHRVLHQA